MKQNYEIDGKYNKNFQDLKKILQDSQKHSQKGLLVTLLHLVTKILFYDKRCFFHKNQLGIGVWCGKPWEIGQKLDFRAFYSKID